MIGEITISGIFRTGTRNNCDTDRNRVGLEDSKRIPSGIGKEQNS